MGTTGRGFWNSNWAKLTLVEIVTEEVRRTRRDPDWTSVRDKLFKMKVEKDKERKSGRFQIRVEACPYQLDRMVRRSKLASEMSASVLARLREFIDICRDISRDVAFVGRRMQILFVDGVVLLADLDSTPSPSPSSCRKDGDEKKSESEPNLVVSDFLTSPSPSRKDENEKKSEPAPKLVRQSLRRLPAPSLHKARLHEGGLGRSNPSLDMEKLEQVLCMFEQQECRSRVFTESLFCGMPKSRIFIDHFIEASTAQSVVEKEDSDTHRSKRKKVLPPYLATKTFHEIEWRSTQRMIRHQIMATFERFHGRLTTLFHQTSCELLELVPQLTESLQSDPR